MNPRVLGLIGAGVLSVAAPLVMLFEGVERQTYMDPVGIPTICFGHTATAKPGMTASTAECKALLQDDMRVALSGVASCVHRELEPHQWAALTSWAFNVGSAAACRSTMVRQINAGAPAEVWCEQLPRWVYAGGRKLTGLERRRDAERALCLGRG